MYSVDFDELERRIMSRFNQPHDGKALLQQEILKQSAFMTIQVLKEYENMKQENQTGL